MYKIKELLKNIGILTISQFGTKILSFLLVPLYTSILSTVEYGSYDICNTTIALLLPFLTVNIKESTLRFSLDKDCDKGEIFTISLKYCVRATTVGLVLVLLNSILNLFVVISDYKWFVLVMLMASAFEGVVSNFSRAVGKMTDIAIGGIISSATIIMGNIIMLIPLKMGLAGYFLSHILGYVAQGLYLFLRVHGWQYINLQNRKLRYLEKKMLAYSAPMIANNTAWWITGVSDRYIISAICGIAENGIYSVASKIPTIIDVIQNIFSQAFVLSVVKDFDRKDENGFLSTTFNVYNCGMTIVCSGIILFSRILARYLYANEFFEAWRYVPFLLIASMMGALAGYIGGIFTALKASKQFASTTLVGAVANIFLNILLIPQLGSMGAAVATAVSYCLIFALRLHSVKKEVSFQIRSIRNNLCYIILFIQTGLLLAIEKDSAQMYILQFTCFLIMLFAFKRELSGIIKMGMSKISRNVEGNK